MPYTLNGCGTMYYGKKSLKKTAGTCSHCGFEGELLDYETRLFVVIVFIPVIPLGKKQIIDYCPKCRRHNAVSLATWKEVRDDTLEQVRADRAKKPSDPEAALALLNSLIDIHEYEEADKVAADLELSFPDNADLQFFIGAWFSQRGLEDRADSCFRRALKLQPDAPDICRAVAIGCIKKGDLSEANRLLRCMEKPGPHQEPSVLFSLAREYQLRNEHFEALGVFETMNNLFPDLAKNNKMFRKAVLQSEKASQRPYTMLPKAPLNKKLIGTLAVVLILIGSGFALNHYLATHQTLYVVNRFQSPASISIEGGKAISIRTNGFQEVTIPQGTITISSSVGGRNLKPATFVISDTFFESLLSEKTYVYNVGSSAVVLWETTTYSTRENVPDNSEYRIHVGQSFLTFGKIDYLFKEFPDSIMIKGTSDEKKSRIAILESDPVTLVDFLLDEVKDYSELIPYMESHLEDNHHSTGLLSYYTPISIKVNQSDHAREFLAKHIADRPVIIEWHKHYQELQISAGADIIQEYDSYIQKEPENSELLYLRGILENQGSKALVFYHKAINANRENPYPWYAKAYYLLNKGDFAMAKVCSQQACSLDPSSQTFYDLFDSIRFAVKDYETLKEECLEILKENPLNTAAFNQVLECTLPQGKVSDAQLATTTFLDAIKSQMPDDPYRYESWCRARSAYLKEDWNELEELAKNMTDEADKKYYMNQLALGRGDMTHYQQTLPSDSDDLYADLLLFIGWTAEGKSALAKESLARAISRMSEGSSEEQSIAQFFIESDPEILRNIDEVIMNPEQKRTILTALAINYPQNRQELLDKASKMNFIFISPKFFLDQAISKLRKI